MEKIIEILNEIKPGAEINEDTRLIDSHILDSIAMITLVNELSDEFDIDISAKYITPENFETPKAIYALVSKIEDEDD